MVPPLRRSRARWARCPPFIPTENQIKEKKRENGGEEEGAEAEGKQRGAWSGEALGGFGVGQRRGGGPSTRQRQMRSVEVPAASGTATMAVRLAARVLVLSKPGIQRA